MDRKDYIIQGFALQGLKTAAYGAGVAVVRAKNAALPVGQDYSPGVNKLPTGKFTGSVSYWAQLQIPAGSYLVVDENGVQSTVEYDGLDFITCLITINMAKNIVMTNIQGRDGSVKEYISDGDYHINIKGVFTEANNVYPEEDVNLLKEICAAKSSVEVVSAWLQQFDITNIVIENYSFPQREGFYNCQIFEINALSDQPIELFIK